MSSVAPSPTSTPLSDRQLLALRCRRDRWGLVGLVAALVTLALLVPGLTALSLVLGAVIALALLEGAIHFASILSSSVPVSPTVAPEWDAAADRVCARVGVTRRFAPLYLVQDPRANAYALWSVAGRAIVVTSGLVALIESDPAAQAYLYAHELAHQLYHGGWWSLIQGFVGLRGPIGLPGRILALGWCRAAEASADRLGVLCAESPAAAARALVAVSAGSRVSDADLPAVLQRLPRRPAGPWSYLAEAFASHPFLRPRLAALFAYTASRQFAQLAGPAAAENACWELAALGLCPDRRNGCAWPA